MGSGGIALSGGQKQRVVSNTHTWRCNHLPTDLSYYYKTLARAVYSRTPTILLDDVFSGLDNTTSQTVFTRLLGNDGILRTSQRAVILATHTGKQPAFATIIAFLHLASYTAEGGRSSEISPFC